MNPASLNNPIVSLGDTGVPQINDLNKNLQDAILRSQQTQTVSLNQQLRNQEASINTAANASGLLYSTMPAFLQSQYIASTYEPAFAKQQANFAKQQYTGVENVLSVANQIRQMNQQANELNNA